MRLMKKFKSLGFLKNGDHFGEIALIGGIPRIASIRCLEDTHFAVISKDDFNKALGAIEKRKFNEKVQFL